jgi:molybdopterin-guanine dinucleotide biosynthesis protein A
MVSAVVLAGGSVKPELQARFGIPSKGMIPLLGRIAVDFVVDAARACPPIGKVALAGPEAYRDFPVIERVDAFVPDAGRIPANLLNAMLALSEQEGQGLMVAGDSPLLTGETLEHFLGQVPAEADLCYPVVSKQGIMAAFPDREWTFLRLREGPVVCTNVLYFRATLLKSFEALADRIEVARRKPWKLAALFGVWLAVKFVTRRLSIPDIERRVSRILGANCRGVLSDDALLAMDLDDLRDLPLVEEFLQKRG